jgi:Mg-chelatase subunit ChlD
MDSYRGDFALALEGLSMFRLDRMVLMLGALAVATAPVRADEKPVSKKPKVEVVFCLDTTGSMGGLIDGAKAKIWSICNQIASGKPTPDLKVGLVAFRDRGDEYITKVFDLSDDLDAIHGHLKTFKAAGGGDIPESVNQALDDSVNKIKWSTDNSTLRIIFLVGDAPPHMDYPDDVKYPVTCKKAAERGIIINTIQCGKDPECTKFWKDICVKAEGSFVQIPQDGGVKTVVATPFDKRLAEINREMADTTLVYGDRGKKDADEKKVAEAKALPAAPAADRAAFGGKGGRAASYDLLDSIKDKRVNLEDLKEEQLPKELQGMTLEKRREFLDKLDKKRMELNKEAVDLDRKRSDFIQKKLAEEKKDTRDSFDTQVLEVLRKQAMKHKIEY